MQSAELVLALLIAVAGLVTIARRLNIAYPIFLVIGGLLGALGKSTRTAGSASRVRTLAWVITALLVVVVYLMEAKPF